MEYSDYVLPDMGIVPRSIKQIFSYITKNPNKAQFQIRVSFMQVYMEMISDLIVENENQPTNKLSKDTLQIREDPKTGIFVQGLKQIVLSF
jgi:Kinesin motor domain